jgi:hypothetical protein
MRDRIYFHGMPPSPFHPLITHWFAERIGEPTSAEVTTPESLCLLLTAERRLQ